MKGARLSPAGRALLALVAKHGPVPRVVLLQAQRELGDGRSENAINRLPESLRYLGLLRHMPGTEPRLWDLTLTGREVVRVFGDRASPPGWVGDVARAVLLHLAATGSADRRALHQVQREANPCRGRWALQQLPYNLVRRGLLSQVPDSRPRRWQITERGRQALIDWGTPNDTLRIARAAPTAPPAPSHITYAKRRVPVPATPRWVFDLAPRGDGS